MNMAVSAGDGLELDFDETGTIFCSTTDGEIILVVNETTLDSLIIPSPSPEE